MGIYVIRKVKPKQIIELFEELPDITINISKTGKVLEDILDHGSMCYLKTMDGMVHHVQANTGVNHLDALNGLTNKYIQANYVSRCTNNDVQALFGEFQDLAAIVFFPKLEVEQVIQIARAKRLLPAGITRFLIPGRVMRLNADLAYLKSDRSLTEKNEWLYELTMDKLSADQVRFYQEPIYLMDE